MRELLIFAMFVCAAPLVGGAIYEALEGLARFVQSRKPRPQPATSPRREGPRTEAKRWTREEVERWPEGMTAADRAQVLWELRNGGKR